MHIEIHIFPDHFSISPRAWQEEMDELTNRISMLIEDATVNAKAAALGKTRLLANDDSGMIVATIDIRRS